MGKKNFVNAKSMKEFKRELMQGFYLNDLQPGQIIKTCRAKECSDTVCTEKIVKAHTISQGSTISVISERNKVLGWRIKKPSSKVKTRFHHLDLVPSSKASTMRIFCSGHDKSLFGLIEDEPFRGTNQQCFLLAFRTIAARFALAEDHRAFWNRKRKLARHLSPDVSEIWENLINHRQIAGIEIAKSSKALYTYCCRALGCQDYTALSHCVIEFDSPLPFVSAGGFAPVWMPDGGIIQNPVLGEAFENIAVSTVFDQRHNFIVFSWRANDEKQIGSRFLEELVYNGYDCEYARVIIRHIQNTFFRPSWFASLHSCEKKNIENLAFHGAEYAGPEQPPLLLASLKQRLPKIMDCKFL